MKSTTFKVLAVFLGIWLTACSASYTEIDAPFTDDALPVLTPGDLIPLNTKVTIETTGIYVLPFNAEIINTRCFGKVTLSYEQPNGEVQANTCHNATGSSSQTNIVTGVADLYFEIETGSYAEITLN